MPACRDYPRAPTTGVRKPAHERTRAVQQTASLFDTLSALVSSVAGSVSPSAFAGSRVRIARHQMQVPSIRCSCVPVGSTRVRAYPAAANNFTNSS